MHRRLGSGGFATVWLAYDEHLDSPVAVKVLGDIWTEDHQVRRRFVEEGRYLRNVESPYVVSVYDAGELDDGRPYLVMSFADQGTLADRLDDEELTAAQTLQVVREIGAGPQALPSQVPQHPECTGARPAPHSRSGDDASVTVVYSGCPGGTVVERVERVTNDELLWIQERSRTQATAATVLDSISTQGI